MRKIIKNPFTILALAVAARLASLMLFNKDPLFFLSPRNFNGRGLLTQPSWFDFTVPLLIIFIFYGENKIPKPSFNKLLKPLGAAFLLIATPAVTGMLLNNYIERYYLDFDFNMALMMRYLLFVLTFTAVNLFADNLKTLNKSKRLKVLLIITLLLSTAYTQDLFGEAKSMYLLLALVNSVGLSTVLFSIGLRRFYKSRPAETILSAALAGIPMIFLVFNVLSVSFFTIFLPFIAFSTVAVLMYKGKPKVNFAVAPLPFLLALFLNYGLPSLVSPQTANELIEKKSEEKFITQKVGGVTVKYKDEKLKEIAVKLAKVINAANEVCDKEFGFSPEVNELVIKGIAPGGFHAEFPSKIVGNIMGEKYLENCADSAFLNKPDLSPNFPDPVNALLHEYSHLFGVIPYHKWWPGVEEEGWATYSATVISRLLAQDGKYRNLWQPSYNYARQAEKIRQRNLSGKAVVWSHPNEFGGFILWYSLGDKLGIKHLYTKRWQNSEHNISGSVFLKSDPLEAKKIVKVFGKDNFIKYGNTPAESFGQLYPLSEYLYLAETCGINKKRIKRMYALMKNRKINPKIALP